MFTLIARKASAASAHQASLAIRARPGSRISGCLNPMTQQQTVLQRQALRFKSSQTLQSAQQSAGVGGDPAAAEATGSQTAMELMDITAQIERQSQVLANIKKQKSEILEGTREGRGLVERVSFDKLTEAGVYEKDRFMQNVDRMEKETRYHIFIDKMTELYKNEKIHRRKKARGFEQMDMAPVQSLTPIRVILNEYSKMTNRGFDCLTLAESLKRLNQAVQARGNTPRTYSDLTTFELDTNWRMDKVAEDLLLALRDNPNIYFSPYNMARVARELGELGYKNTEIYPLWFDKLHAMYDRAVGLSPQIDYEGSKITIEDYIFGGMKGLTPRHYIFQGYQASQEFQEHLQTLKMWEADQRESFESFDEAQLVEQAMKEVIDAAAQIKDLQKEQEGAVINLRNQYFRLLESNSKNEFLKEHKYIKYDLLELQELMMQAGYIMPSEDPEKALAQRTRGMLGMQAASEIFYNIALNYRPQLLSPQYDAINDAAQAVDYQRKPEVRDQHDQLNIMSLTSTLIGLEKQAMSFRRDVKDQDYPTDHYRDHLLPEEKMLGNEFFDLSLQDFIRKYGHKYVQMERSYLTAWQTFLEKTSNVDKMVENLLTDHSTALECFSGLGALSSARFAAPDLRDRLVQAANDRLKRSGSIWTDDQKSDQLVIDLQAVSDGLVGLASCTHQPEGSKQLVSQLCSEAIKHQHHLTFRQKAEMLYGLTSLVAREDKVDRSVKDLIAKLVAEVNTISFASIVEDLFHGEISTLYQVFVNMKTSKDKSISAMLATFNETLLNSMENYHQDSQLYVENGAARYDPLKPRVMQGLTESFTRANLKTLHEAQTGDSEGIYRDLFPAKPDLLMGYQGKKVAFFLLSQADAMRDDGSPQGSKLVSMNQIENAHRQLQGKSVQCHSLPITDVVTFDLANYQIALQESFNVDSFLQKTGLAHAQTLADKLLVDFTEQIGLRVKSDLDQAQTSGVFDDFLGQVLALMKNKDRLDVVYEAEQIVAARDEAKYQLLKLQIQFHDSLSAEEKRIIEGCVPGGYQGFDALVDAIKKDLSVLQPATTGTKERPFWMGQRMEVEMPSVDGHSLSKNIDVELLSQKFFFEEDYHHYEDWKALMESTYDNFNLLQVPKETNKEVYKVYFDGNDFNRRIPYGIFPYASHKRVVLEQPLLATESLSEATHHQDRFNQFQKGPYEYLVANELARTKELADITPNVSMITNLQNVKQGLKSDYSDERLTRFLFEDLTLTEKLIEEHLAKLGGAQTSVDGDDATFVTRDPACFRKFATRSEPTVVSPYDHFFMREALRKGDPEKIYREIQKLQKSKDADLSQDEIERKYKQIEDLILNYEMIDKDHMNLVKALDNELEVNVDLSEISALKPRTQENRLQGDRDMTDAAFLERERCRAEATLVKSRIVYKLYNLFPLSANEKKYLEAWHAKSQDMSTVMNAADVMVPASPSQLTLGDMDPNDVYALNSIPRVSFDPSTQAGYAVNDIVLELSHLLDPETLRKVELTMLEDTLKREWNLQEAFRLANPRNKEADLAQKELEEVSWRISTAFSDSEYESVREMVSVDRNWRAFDKEFYSLDMESLDQFFQQVNTFDDRMRLLENWICRKEQEYRTRVNLPTPELQRPDGEIHAQIDAPLKKARESMLGKMLTEDAYGNQTPAKKYGELTTPELSMLVESLAIRLNLFKKEYPVFVPHVVKAIMEHPSLAKADRTTMETYCRLFELDWRGDNAVENREMFLLEKPVYANEDLSPSFKGVVSEEWVTQKLRMASLPYLPNVIRSMKQVLGKR